MSWLTTECWLKPGKQLHWEKPLAPPSTEICIFPLGHLACFLVRLELLGAVASLLIMEDEVQADSGKKMVILFLAKWTLRSRF